MTIRPLKESDLPSITQLYCDVFNTAPWNDGWDYERAYERLRRFMAAPGAFGLVSLEGDAPVAFVLGTKEQWTDSEHFHLKEMCVIADKQRGGQGTKLLGALDEALRREGVTRMYLQTLPGSPAGRFYEKLGLTESRLRIYSGPLGQEP